MCHNSGIEKGEQQIERYMAFGLPSRAVKSVKYTMRKREKQQQKKEQQKLRQRQQQQEQYLEELELSSSSGSGSGSNNYSDSEDSGTDITSMQLASAEAAQMVDTDTDLELEAAETKAEIVTYGAAAVAVTAAVAVAVAENLTLTETHNTKGSSIDNSSSNNNSEIFKIPKMCGRFRKLQQQQQQQQQQEQQQQVEDISQLKAQQQRKLSSMEPSMDDALAIGTQMTRKVSERIACLVAQLQGSRLYTILTRTTQPAHLIAVCILVFVLMTVGRDLIEGSPATTPTTTTRTLSSSSSTGGGGGSGTLPNLVYLGAFATHFGSQIWMTFVSGLSLYFSLPRHIFGQCQQILFPRYFAFNAVLSLTMLVTYAKYFLSGWTTASGIQVGSLALAAGIEVVVRLYLVPPMLKLMHEKYKIEDAIGSGQEVGSLVQGDLIDCPHYQRVHKGFRRIHMTIAIGNMTVMLATCLQLYFLASKIHLS
ncbi:transcription factor kayak [Drosophila miranda]|uniref:transcription factor kayak n=1 Tax=Drosophila miranda TaxID=7229 RepID=UPI0007E632B9|nr:transcription factor kayak [Drosophila miranda]